MDKLYVIYANRRILVIKAKDEQEVFDKYVRSLIDTNDELFEKVNDFTVNWGLLEDFFEDEKGHLLNDYGEYRKDLLKKYPDEKALSKYVDSQIRKNVSDYWSDAPECAEEYLRELNKAWNSESEEFTPAFSEDFYVDTFKRIISSGSWYDDFGIKEIDVSEHDIQVISNGEE
ncbi:hypothetical protein QUF56_12200 [Ureibacillus composti]|nr:hypothetical protein [Ureibacillus composti]